MGDAGNRTLVIATGHGLSLALGEGQTVLAFRDGPAGPGAAESLMPALAGMLRPFGGNRAGVGRILVEVGPGSFTGLRIGHAVASALALGWGLPLAGIRSTLLVAAEHGAGAEAGDTVGVAIRAPRGQYWVERFHLPSLYSLGEPLALLPDEVAEWIGQGPLVGGPGWPDGDILPRAAAALLLHPRLFSEALPIYVRRQDDICSA